MSIRKLPQTIESLNKIAHNYWWSWNADAWELFSSVNPKIWADTRNPVKVLFGTSDSELEELSTKKEFVDSLNSVSSNLESYLANEGTWFNESYPQHKGKSIAYFSAEYGIHEALPIYSGGLGVLSGDHVKSTSDLGIPGVFVGLLYKDGYFIQQIDGEGQQVDVYEVHDPNMLSVLPALGKDGKQVEISVNLAGRDVYARVWTAKVGRCDLLLIDSNVEKNSEIDRELTARLYGGDREMRISQEMLLGNGGIKVLNALEIEPAMYHMNEGHSGFFQLERVKNIMSSTDLSFEEAKILCASNCVFTTHTPVPAGNEAFTFSVMHKYFYNYVKDLGISWDRFLKLGMVDEGSDNKYFSLTVFAINFSRFQNGVSELHGRIAKKMWRDIWTNVPEVDNTIEHITNGIHVETWASPEVKTFLSKSFGEEWKQSIDNQDFWNKIYEVPAAEVRETIRGLKGKMVSLVRSRLKEQLERNGESAEAIAEADTFLRDDVLTIGFARRFATYKRANLIFKDEKRLAKIVNDPKRPVQFVFAGKAHPADVPGQKFIKEIYEMSRKPEFKGKVIILENYDMHISRHLVSGSDVWLNNPRRPMEASGTSGQKVPINFGLNFSVLDGWWREGYNGDNGWKIGEEKDYPNDEVQDFEDANDFYKTLEQTIAPLYYDNNDEWFEKTKNSFVTNIARFSMMRQVKDYMNKLYDPAIEYGATFRGDSDYAKVRSYITDRRYLRRKWETVCFGWPQFDGEVISVESNYEKFAGTPSHHVEIKLEDTLPGRVYEATSCDVEIPVYLGDIDPSNVKCELVLTDDKDEDFYEAIELMLKDNDGNGTSVFAGNYTSENGDPQRMRFRVYPVFEGIRHSFELGFAEWF